MEICSVYIEKIENKVRALWVLGVFAREKEGTMPAHAHARPAGRPAPVPGRAGLGHGHGHGHGFGFGFPTWPGSF